MSTTKEFQPTNNDPSKRGGAKFFTDTIDESISFILQRDRPPSDTIVPSKFLFETRVRSNTSLNSDRNFQQQSRLRMSACE
jgi:hypothetical protein